MMVRVYSVYIRKNQEMIEIVVESIFKYMYYETLAVSYEGKYNADRCTSISNSKCIHIHVHYKN